MTGEKASGLSTEDLQFLPAMQSGMREAKKQVKQYGNALEQKYNDLRLNRYAVVSLGFERLWWQKVKDEKGRQSI